MKKHISQFLIRGLISCGFGPIVLAILYLILNKNGVIETLSAEQVAVGIFSITALAFVAGGINVIYQIERLPLMLAIFLHGAALYCGYLITYLVNDWLEAGMIPMLVFTAIFVFGYIVIWAVIYSVIKSKTKKLNEMIKRKQGL